MGIKEKIMYPDYGNNLVNIPNSILKWFGLPLRGKSHETIDKLLEKDYKNVVLLLLDGMGTFIMEENLNADGPFRQHFKESISTVFLPTTVAATTSAITGLHPCEHGWLGWESYIPQIDKNVVMFLNTIQNTEIQAADYNVGHTFLKYESVVEIINKSGGLAYSSMPFLPPFPQDLDSILDRIKSLCSEEGKKYIYAYWNQPDGVMHKTGIKSSDSRSCLKEIEEKVNKVVDNLEDTLVIITADHGHIDNRTKILDDYPEIVDCLVRTPSLEPRAINFFIKDGMNDKFISLFNKEFGEDFMLLSKEEYLSKKLMGEGKYHEHFLSMLGDYIAVAVSDLSVFFSEEPLVSMHGGLTEKEMLVPLVIYEK